MVNQVTTGIGCTGIDDSVIAPGEILTGQIITNSTNPPTPTSGQIIIAGNLPSPPSLTNSPSGEIYLGSGFGLHLQGIGSTGDVSLENRSGTVAAYVPTGTQNLQVNGDIIVIGSTFVTPTTGQVIINGLTNNQTFTGLSGAGSVYLTSTSGVTLQGSGSINDLVLRNNGGGAVALIPTGSGTFNITGGTLTVGTTGGTSGSVELFGTASGDSIIFVNSLGNGFLNSNNGSWTFQQSATGPSSIVLFGSSVNSFILTAASGANNTAVFTNAQVNANQFNATGTGGLISGANGTSASGKVTLFGSASGSSVITVNSIGVLSVQGATGNNIFFNDGSNGSMVIMGTAGGAIANHITLIAAQTGSAPTVEAQGSDTNVNLNLAAQGTGYVNFSGTGYATPAPVTVTSSVPTVTMNAPSVIFNPSTTTSVTLPSASTNSGAWLRFKNISTQAITSASSNVILLTGGAATTTIIASTAGKWVHLQSDGLNWQVMSGN